MGANKQRKQRRVLKDHEPRGKVFVPPFVAKLEGSIREYSWTDHLPDVLWIGLLVDALGIKHTLEVAQTLAGCVNLPPEIPHDSDKAPLFASEYGLLGEEQWKSIRENVEEAGFLDEVQSALAPLSRLYPDFPMNPLLANSKTVEELDEADAEERVRESVRKIYDNRSKPGLALQAVAIWIAVRAGRLPFPRTLTPDDLNKLLNDFHANGARSIASRVRMSFMLLFSVGSKDEDAGRGKTAAREEWVRYFWKRSLQVSSCRSEAIQPEESHYQPLDSSGEVEAPGGFSQQQIMNLGLVSIEYTNHLHDGLEETWRSLNLSALSRIRCEVLGGLMARQLDLAKSILSLPPHWGSVMGRTVLRAMADTCILLTWFVKNGKEADFEAFIEHGLGQEKLALEHMKDVNPDSGVLNERIEITQSWIAAQKATWLLPVNVGAWKKENMRELAQECGLYDLYRLIYSPRSADAHGMWNSLSLLSLTRCTNPLHQFHHVPRPNSQYTSLGFAADVAHVTAQTISGWSEAFEVEDFGRATLDEYLAILPDVLTIDDADGQQP